MPSSDKQARRQKRLKRRQAAERRRASRQDAGFLCGLAEMAHTASDADGALRLARKALALAPAYGPALELMARICFKGGWYEEAAFHFRQCRRHGSNPMALYYCGQANLRLGRREEAAADFRELVSLLGEKPELQWRGLRQDALYWSRRLAEPGTQPPEQEPRPSLFDPRSSLRAKSPETPLSPPPPPPPPAPEPLRVAVALVSAGVPDFAGATAGTLADYDLRRRLERLRLAQSFEDLVCLSTLHGVDSYGHQHLAVRKVLRQFKGRALLADEVGLGKTIEACLVLKEYWLRGMVRKALVLVPPSLVAQWKGELSEKFGFSPVSPDSAEFRRDPERFWRQQPLIVASIAMARLDPHGGLLATVPWDMVIVDEAHCLKSRGSANWKLVNALQKRFILMLTATPVENHLVELYNLITVLKPGLLSTEADFRRQFIAPARPSAPKNPERLRGLLGEVMVRNTRSAVNVRLPPRVATSAVVPPSPEEAQLYETVSSFVRARYRPAGEMLALKWLQRQAGSSPQALSRAVARALAQETVTGDGERRELEGIQERAAEIQHSAKALCLAQMLAARPGKAVVFTEFVATLEHLAGVADAHALRYAVFRGDMTRAEKDAAIAQFRDEADVLLSTGAGGEGRNLQFADTVVNFDLPWNPMRLEQRVGRVHRIGQTRQVFIFNFCQAGTIEEQLLRVLHDKINMFELVVGEIDSILGTLEEGAEFSDVVLELWVSAADLARRIEAFDDLAEKLLAAKKQYARTKQLDDALFQQDFQS